MALTKQEEEVVKLLTPGTKAAKTLYIALKQHGMKLQDMLVAAHVLRGVLIDEARESGPSGRMGSELIVKIVPDLLTPAMVEALMENSCVCGKCSSHGIKFTQSEGQA